MLTSLTVCNVGDGLCMACRADDDISMMIDCGSMNAADTAADALRRTAKGYTPVVAFTLSHFHCDHYNGVNEFAVRYPSERVPIGDVYYAKMPKIRPPAGTTGPSNLGSQLLAALFALNGYILGRSGLPLQTDIVRVVQQISNQNVVGHPKSKGDHIYCGGGDYEVLWPPDEVSDDETTKDVKGAIDAFDQARKTDPALNAALDWVQEADLVSMYSLPVLEPYMMAATPPPAAIGQSPVVIDPIIQTANQKVKRAADRLSLAFKCGEQLLFMGDLKTREIGIVASDRVAVGDDTFRILVTPHHGTRWHQAVKDLNIRSRAVSSIGDGLWPHRKDDKTEYGRYNAWWTHKHFTFKHSY